MSQTGLVINEAMGVTTVSFRAASILDGMSVEQIGKELYTLVDEYDRRKIVLDMHQVRFLSSSMLGVLVTLHRKAVDANGKVVISGLKPELMKVFKITKLHKMLEFAPNEHEAMHHFEPYSKA
jgi:anti-anti-sigma factor